MIKDSYLIYSNCGRNIIRCSKWKLGGGIIEYLECDNILGHYLYYIETGDIYPDLDLAKFKLYPTEILKIGLICWASPWVKEGTANRRRTLVIFNKKVAK